MICNIIDFTALIPFINKNKKKVYTFKANETKNIKKKIKTCI